jgi:peptidoglycan/LPS O-acetylase OafA/YrhL
MGTHMVRSSRHPRFPAPGAHIPSLDGLRGIAVLVVVILHFSFLEPHNPLELLFLRVTSVGWVGVDLFFVLSGFLITGILIDTRTNDDFFRSFFLRRTLRIFPLYYAFLFLVFVALPIVRASGPEPHRLWLLSYLGNVLMATGGWEAMPSHTTHLWSLAVEEQFYLLWPLVVYWADGKKLVRICALAFLLAIGTRIGLHLYTANGIAGYTLLPARLDPLAAGALLATLVRTARGAELVLRSAKPVALGSLALLLGIAGWNLLARPLGSPLPPLALNVQVAGYPAIALLAAAVVVMAITAGEGSYVQRLLTSTPLRSLGRYSYAIYLFHVPLRDAMRSRFLSTGSLPLVFGSQILAQLAVILVGLSLTYLLAIVSWHAYEKHFLGLKDRLAPSTGAVPAPSHPLAAAGPALVGASPPAA